MPCARHSSAILAPALDACSTNEIFELMTRCSFQGIPRLSTCQRSHGRKPVSDVLALDPKRMMADYLQRRDLEILRTLARLRYMTTKEIVAGFFATPTVGRRRIRRLS